MSSFIDQYLYICGESEVSPHYHLWSCLSLIAAAVADRVWTEKFGKLTPNLYVALLGPSANGKDTAIDMMMDLAAQHPRIGALNFRSTAPGLLQYMSRNRVDETGAEHANSRVFLVMPEVSFSLRKGDIADDFVKTVTGLYSGKPYPLHDITITRGQKILCNYSINIILGSVMEWLLDVIPHTAISGGTFGRFVGVHLGYPDFNDRSLRHESPRFPVDRHRALDELHARLRELTEIEGVFTLTPIAQRLMSTWYDEREVPTDESLIPAWRRQHDLVKKLGMLLALANGATSEALTISANDIWRAQELSESVIRRLSDIQAAASTSKDTQGIVFVRGVLKSLKRRVLHTELLRRLYGKGIGGSDELKAIIETLVESGEVARLPGPTPRSNVYQWIGTRKRPRSELEPTTETPS